MSGGGGHGRRRTRGGHEEEHENHERWAVSYADMMTVLCALFIVLYAISQVDQVKYEALAQSLAEGFNNRSAAILDGSPGVLDGAVAGNPQAPALAPVDPVALVDPRDASAADRAAAAQEVIRLQDVRAQIEARLAAAGMSDGVRFVIDERGLVVGMVANDVFFQHGSAALQPAARTLLDAVAPVLAAVPDRVSVEGHADVVPTSGRYATNWELSADRATQVLRHLVETGGVPGVRISATGYGDTRPLDPGTSPEALAANRRVDLVVHSPQPERVRGLIPSVLAGAAAAAPPPVQVAPPAPQVAHEAAADTAHDDEGH